VLTSNSSMLTHSRWLPEMVTFWRELMVKISSGLIPTARYDIWERSEK
jgi:hypothetical protein